MAKHWGDVFAAKCQLANPDLSPWNRYVDPSVVGWSDVLTGTTSIIVDFLDDLIQLGYTGQEDRIVKARDAGRRFLNEQMLPAWWVNDTWGRTYWDWDNPMMCGMVSMCADHFMKYPQAYPNWRNDLRNMLSLVWNRNGADPASQGDVYSGAWAFPESSVCCGTSLSYNQYTAGPTLIRYGVLADSDWALEIGRRMMLMATYDSLPNGVVKDGLLGDQSPPASGRTWPIPGRYARSSKPSPGSRSTSPPTGKTTSCAPPQSCTRSGTNRAASATQPSMHPPACRKCCGWPFARPQSGPMADD